MSIACMSHVWKHSSAHSGGLLLLLAIADYANEDGVAWPGLKALCQKARLSERHVQRIIRELIVRGELEVEYGGGKHHTNKYRVITPPRSHPFRKGTPSFKTQTPTSETEKGGVDVTRTVIEPSETRQILKALGDRFSMPQVGKGLRAEQEETRRRELAEQARVLGVGR